MLHIKKIRPLYTSIVTTGDKFEKDMIDGNIIVARKGDLKLWQKVIAVGSTVRDVKVGDMVMINAEHFAVKRYNKNSLQNDIDNNPVLDYKFNWVTIDNALGEPQECLLINDRDVEYVFEGEERDDSIILPGKKNIVLS